MRVVPWGSLFILQCAECGEVGRAKDYLDWRNVWEHQRYEHPTEDEAALDHLREFEHEMYGCSRCGHDDHESVDCPLFLPMVMEARG